MPGALLLLQLRIVAYSSGVINPSRSLLVCTWGRPSKKVCALSELPFSSHVQRPLWNTCCISAYHQGRTQLFRCRCAINGKAFSDHSCTQGCTNSATLHPFALFIKWDLTSAPCALLPSKLLKAVFLAVSASIWPWSPWFCKRLQSHSFNTQF